MQDTPLTSASDILSYHGDAGLASGSGAGTLPVMPDYQPMLSTVDKLQDEQVQKRREARLQAQKDLQDRAQFISQLTNNGGSIFNMKGKDGSNQSYSMLPNDQEDVNKSALNIIQAVNANPSGYAYDPSIAKMQMDHNRLAANAQMRSTYETQARLAAANTMDPEEKAGYLQSIDDNINKYKVGDFHQIQPYVPPIKYSDADRLDLDAVKDPKNLETKLDDGHFETKIPNEGVVGNTLNLAPGDKAYLPNMDMAAKFLRSPLAHSQPDLLRMKQAQDTYNALNQYQPGDPKYRDVVVVDPNTGQATLNITGDPKVDGLKVADMLNIEKYAQPRKIAKAAEKVATIAQEQANTAQTLEKTKEEQGKYGYEIQKLQADISEKNAQTQKLKGDERIKSQKEKEAMQETYAPVADYLNVVKDVKGKKFGTIPAPVAPALTNAGLVPGNYTAAILNPTDQSIAHIAGIQGVDEKGKPMNRVVNPTGAFYLKSKTGNPKDDMIAVNAGGTWKTIKPTEAVENIIKSQKNFQNISDKTVHTIGESQSKLNSIFANFSKPATEAKNAPTILKTKNIRGVTYEQHSDGQWYPAS